MFNVGDVVRFNAEKIKELGWSDKWNTTLMVVTGNRTHLTHLEIKIIKDDNDCVSSELSYPKSLFILESTSPMRLTHMPDWF